MKEENHNKVSISTNSPPAEVPVDDEKESISNRALYSVMVASGIFGALLTLSLKRQDQIQVGGAFYVHPYLQTANVFLGQFSCLFVFAVK